MAMMPAPAYLNSGIAAKIATAMQQKIGVCKVGCTLDNVADAGRRLSRDMPKHSRMVAVMMARQHTRMAADTTAR